MLACSLGLFFKRSWTVKAWNVSLLYYVAVAVFVFLLPTIRDNDRVLAAHHYPGLSQEMWAFSLAYLTLPLVAGLLLRKFLPAFVAAKGVRKLQRKE